METHTKGAYQQFSPSSSNQKDTLASLVTLKRYSKDQQYSKRLTREVDIKAQEAQLFGLKETIPETNFTMKRPFTAWCCDNCTFTSRQTWVKKTTENLVVSNVLAKPILISKERRPVIQNVVFRNEEIEKAVEKMSLEQLRETDSNDENFYKDLLRRNRKRADTLLNKLSDTCSSFALRFVSWTLSKVLPHFVSAICVHEGQLKMLKEASSSNLPIVFLPMHKSYLDPLLISFILFKYNLRTPLMALDDHFNIPLIGRLLRGYGAFFMKTNIDRKDYVYEAVLNTYLKSCLRAGHHIEFFLESGRTITGKPSVENNKLLGVIIDAMTDGTLDDVLVVPVALNYDKLIDGNFVRDQLNRCDKRNTFLSIMKKLWTVLFSHYGTIRVDFNQPFSLKEFMKTFNLKYSKAVLDINADTLNSNAPNKCVDLEQNISRHVIYGFTQSMAVMSTNAVAFLLLTKWRDGATLEQLSLGLDSLRKELDYFRKDVGFVGDSIEIVKHGIKMLGSGLVRSENNLIKPYTDLPNVIELAYYSNSVLPHFALDAVIALALNACNIIGGDQVYHDELIKKIMELFDILRYEFLFYKPCQDPEQVIVGAIDDLVIKKGIFVTDYSSELQQRSRKIAIELDEDEIIPKTYKIVSSKEALDHLEYLRQVLTPILDTYAIAARSLRKLVGVQYLESDLVDEAIEDIKSRLTWGTLNYPESVSTNTIKNAFKLFQAWEILECHIEGELKVFYLKEESDNFDSLMQVCNRIDKYRF